MQSLNNVKKKKNGFNVESAETSNVDLNYGYIQPQAKEAEAAVLGAILIEADAIEIALQYLRAESFYSFANQKIFDAFIDLFRSNKKIDLITLCDYLQTKIGIETVGGISYVSSLTNYVVSSANLAEHCMIIHEKYLYREQIRIASNLIATSYQQTTDPFELNSKVLTELGEINNISAFKKSKNITDLLINEAKRVEDLRLRNDYITGVPTDYRYMDIITGGWQDEDLIIIAARPSIGKTAFALNLARNAAMHKTKQTPVGIFSLEMSAQLLIRRLLSRESGINLELLNSPKKLNDAQLQAFYEKGLQALSSAPIEIDDTAGITLTELKIKARRMKKEKNIGLLIIDYLQLMSGDVKSGNREQEISTISRGLKALGKELHIPIIALSQLSRDLEKQGREPMLSDLRESGAIEQDADLVMFLTRPNYQKLENENEAETEDVSFLADVTIRKHRNGALDKIPFCVDLSIQRWFSPDDFEIYKRNKQQASFYQNKTVAKPYKDSDEDEQEYF